MKYAKLKNSYLLQKSYRKIIISKKVNLAAQLKPFSNIFAIKSTIENFMQNSGEKC